MSTSETLHRTVAVHDGSDLALKDENPGWSKIHRVAYVTRLSAYWSAFDLICGLKVTTKAEARSLSSGWLGPRCGFCWRHLNIDRDVA